jgi:hypothetical protein
LKLIKNQDEYTDPHSLKSISNGRNSVEISPEKKNINEMAYTAELERQNTMPNHVEVLTNDNLSVYKDKEEELDVMDL